MPVKFNTAVLNVMRGYVGVVEPTGHNDGEQINKFQNILGLQTGSSTRKGDPYCNAALVCASLVVYAGMRGVDPAPVANLKALLPDLKKHIPISGSVGESISQARALNMWLPKKNATVPRAGDWICFDFGDEDNPKRHIGIIERLSDDNTTAYTIEANTSPDVTLNETNDPKSGGVFRRKRFLTSINVLGCIRIPEQL